MRSLITGINGFIGPYLAKKLEDEGNKVIGVSRDTIDIRDFKQVFEIVKKTKPDRIFHLAAQSNIPYSFSHPQETIETNLIGTLNFLETLRLQKKRTVFVSVGSSAEYGLKSPYAVSKAAQSNFVQIYKKAYGVQALHVRPFAIIGPEKKSDAIYDFCRGIVAIEQGKKEYLSVGNLSHIRDFMDIRDAVSAIILTSKKNNKYDTCDICLGKGRTLRSLLDLVVKQSSRKIIVKIDPKKIRPSDDQIIVGNPKRLFSLGFKPKYRIEQTLNDILNFWRKNS